MRNSIRSTEFIDPVCPDNDFYRKDARDAKDRKVDIDAAASRPTLKLTAVEIHSNKPPEPGDSRVWNIPIGRNALKFPAHKPDLIF